MSTNLFLSTKWAKSACLVAAVACCGAWPFAKGDEIVGVSRDWVKGSYRGGVKQGWSRVTGKAKVLDARTLELADKTRIELEIDAPYLEQMGMIGDSLYPCGRQAAEFLRLLIGDRPVICFQDDDEPQGTWQVFAGDTNIEQAMIAGGWAFDQHHDLATSEVIARTNNRGIWRGKFTTPDDWHVGVRLPGEPPPAPLRSEHQAQKLIGLAGRRNAAREALVARIVSDLPGVRRLNFTNSNLTNSELGQLTRLTELTELHLGGASQLTDEGLAQLLAMPQLERLNLPFANAAVLAHVKSLSNLTYLNLEWARPNDEGLEQLADLSELRELNLSYSAITDAGFAHFARLHHLRRLNLYQVKITDAGLAHLRGLANLAVLDLRLTRLTDAGLSHVAGLVNLEHLDISVNQITDEGVLKLTGLKKLRVLRLPKQITEKARARLKEAIPTLEFEGRPEDIP